MARLLFPYLHFEEEVSPGHLFWKLQDVSYHLGVDLPAETPAALGDAVMVGTVQLSDAPHVDTGVTCSVFTRADMVRLLWLPNAADESVILQDGIEGEGQWFVATPEQGFWQIRRDYWDPATDESAEEVVFSGSRAEAVDRLVAILLNH